MIYFRETGKHLDIQNVTLCAGSRSAAGNVPCVDWNDGEVRVRYYDPGLADGDRRGRSVVL